MPTSFLATDALARYGRFDGEPDAGQLSAFFHLSDPDLELISAQSTPASRLGQALQLGCVRYLGTFVADLATVPLGIVAFVAQQIDVDVASLPGAWVRGGTASRHRALIQRHDGYRRLREPAVALALTRWLAKRAWTSDERPEVLFDLAAARLRQQRVLLPGPTTLERLVVAVQARMEARRAPVTDAARPRQRPRPLPLRAAAACRRRRAPRHPLGHRGDSRPVVPATPSPAAPESPARARGWC